MPSPPRKLDPVSAVLLRLLLQRRSGAILASVETGLNGATTGQPEALGEGILNAHILGDVFGTQN